ncbi:MAG: glycosyltransferase family 2 protein [Desulfobulbaceae bacterium]|nr:glycosyltransferase family 2 protein [Desulfobulbaceae bacterium]
MKKNLLSVIIPTYNRRSFLEQAIRSVLDQSQPCDELIVVDDGSTDTTKGLVRGMAERSAIPVRYLYQENRGAAAARNLGIREAAGDLICFLDSDDRFVAHKLAVQKRVLEESNCLVSHTGEKWLRRGRHLNQKRRHQPPDGYIFAACLRMCVVGMSTVLARRELFQRYGMFDQSLPCCEDYDFWLRVSCREQFRLVPQPLTIKNGGRDDQLSVIHRRGMDRFRIRALVNLLDRGVLNSGQYSQAVQELRRKCAIYGNGCIKHGRIEEGRKYLAMPEKY